MDFIELLKVFIIGVVEGISEWLPISSTGHMILVDELIKLNASEAFKEMFFVVIQLGAILAVCVIFFHKLNPLSPRKSASEKHDTWSLWGKVIVATLPAAIVGLPFDDILDKYFYNYQTVALMLIVYGVLFIIVENRNKNKRPVIRDFSQFTYKTAFFIGLIQLLALIPGTSRSGATILGAILLGCSRYVAAEFSFFLAIPVMVGASLLKILKFGLVFTQAELFTLLFGMFVAFVTSIIVIRYFLDWIKKHDFKVFGWYRIVLGIIVLAYFIFIA